MNKKHEGPKLLPAMRNLLKHSVSAAANASKQKINKQTMACYTYNKQ